MRPLIILLLVGALVIAACKNKPVNKELRINPTEIMNDSIAPQTGYSDVNGIKIYYEIYGKGQPLVLIPGGGSTIESSFGRIIPLLAAHYQVISLDLQNHGRSGFRKVPETFEQDADDVAGLVKNLGVGKANFLGFSNGGTTAMQIAIRHPEIVDKLVLAAAAFKREGLPAGFSEMMEKATFPTMPQPLKDAFLKVNPDSAKLLIMFDKDRQRMVDFKDIPEEQIRAIKSPALVINGDADVTSVEHALEISRLIPHSQLAIIPGGHGRYVGEVLAIGDGNRDIEFVVPMIRAFLDKPVNK